MSAPVAAWLRTLCALLSVGGAVASFHEVDFLAPKARVDLVVSMTLPLDGAFMRSLWRSVERYWTPGMPDSQLLVLCLNCNGLTPEGMPQGAKLVQQTGPACMHSMVQHQWTDFDAVLHTSAEYLAFIDSDAVFHTPVQPHNLLSEDGQPFVITRNESFFHGGLSEMLGRGYNTSRNYMTQLPFVVRSETVRALRAHVEAQHRQPWDDVWCKLFHDVNPTRQGVDISGRVTFLKERMPCNFCLMGAFIENTEGHRSRYDMRVEGLDVGMVRVASHVYIDEKLNSCDYIEPWQRSTIVSGPAAGGRFLDASHQLGKLSWGGTREHQDAVFERSKCFAPGMATGGTCKRERCTTVYYPLLNWQGAVCWASHGKETPVRQYMRQVGLLQDYEACHNSPQTSPSPSQCSCPEIQSLREHLHTLNQHA